MAVEAFTVIYNKTVAGSQFSGAAQETTKTNAEALHRKFKEKVLVISPVYDAKIVEVETEEEKQAAAAAKYILGANEQEGELLVAKSTNVKKNSARS